MGKKADLHIHSYYSDGTMSPEEILNIAMKKNIGLLAITDHDIIDGSMELMDLCSNHSIKCISGVELDAVQFGINYHILGYGIDFFNTQFVDFVKKNRKLLEEVNVELIKKMEDDYPHISLEDYKKFDYDKNKGGWKTLHYFVEKGLSKALSDGFAIYAKYEHSYTCVDFPTIDDVCREIHNAGGKAVLAHPGKVIKKSVPTDFSEEIHKIINCGIDGIECYYPSHTEELTNLCLSICEKNSLLITCGSDCHGEFEKTEIGEINISMSQLVLGDLVQEKSFARSIRTYSIKNSSFL